MAGNYTTFMKKVLQEWKSFTGWAFEDVCRELLVEELIAEYPKIGSWWDRKGNEIDVVGINYEENKVLLIEIKNMELSEDSARKILKSTADKVGYIKGSSGMQVSVAIAARRVQGRKRLESDGFRVWELGDLLEEKTVPDGRIS
jgi:AAA+ ATPase superfamily predicted ATPase